MFTNNFYKYIAIEGNIGIGKTTLAKKLCAHVDGYLVLEKFRKNHFLPLFYNDMTKYGLHVELSFLVDRFEDHNLLNFENPVIISDYFFLKTLLFARINLDKHAFRIFERVYSQFERKVIRPDLIIFLKRDINQLLTNIKNRRRGSEQQIQPEYLLQVQKSYEAFLNKTDQYRILSIDVADVDLRKDETIKEIVALIDKPYNYGITNIKI